MSRRFLPGCCRAVARRAPRGYRSGQQSRQAQGPARKRRGTCRGTGTGEGGNEQIQGTQNKGGRQ